MTREELKIICDRVFLEWLPDEHKSFKIEAYDLRKLVLQVLSEIRGNDFNELMLHLNNEMEDIGTIGNVSMSQFYIIVHIIISMRVKQLKDLIKSFELED